MSWRVFNEPNYVFGTGVGITPIPVRIWTIVNLGDEYGFISGVIGDLNPDDWFDGVNTIVRMFLDDSSNATILRASNDSQWNGLDDVTLRIEGFTDVVLSYNGTFYFIVDVPLRDYIVSQSGNTLGLRILPEI